MVGKPSDTRLQILEFIVTYMENHAYSPTRDEISEAVGLSSRSSVQYHVDTLVEDGYVERSTYRHRMIRPTDRGLGAIEALRTLDGSQST